MRLVFLDVPLPGMDIWSLWYQKYIDKAVFCSAGYTVGTSTFLSVSKPQSEFFCQYFRNGNVDYVGRCNRYVRLKDKEIVNTSFSSYLTRSERVIPSAYRKIKPNLEGGFKSISKYDKAQPVLDEAAWKLSGAWTQMHFSPFMGGSSVVSEDIAIKESKKDTSCGYPWSLEFKDKNAFYASERARPALRSYWDLIATEDSNLTFVPIWTCSEKVELRSLEKIRDNKIRTFTASPVEHSVACNRLCLDMNNRFYSSNNKHWSFVGANKYQQGWNNLYLRLSKHPNGFELDETEYDSSLFARAMWGQRDIRWDMLRHQDKTSENKRRLDAIYESIVNSVIILENGELIRKHTGNPSGSANTIVDNTMILFRLFAYAWILLVEQHYGVSNLRARVRADARDATFRDEGVVFGSYLDFMNHVEAALNGDDNTFTCSDKVVGWFNPTTISAIWTAIGVTTKTPCSSPRPVRELTFLSHSFKKADSGLYFPCPETERVLCSLMYGSDRDDVRWHLLRACALRIDSWPNEEVREVLQGYIEHLNYHYGESMVGSVEIDQNVFVSMREIRAVWKPDAWIEALYSGFEGSDGNRTIGPNKNFSYTEFLQFINLISTNEIRAPERQQAMPSRNTPKPHNPSPKTIAKRQRQKPKPATKMAGPRPMTTVTVRQNVPKQSSIANIDNSVRREASSERIAALLSTTSAFAVYPGVAGADAAAHYIPIQAGLSTTFRRLSRIARLYNKFRVVKFRVKLVPLVSEYNPATLGGKVIVTYVADAGDPYISDVTQLLACPSRSDVSVNSLTYDVPIGANSKWLYIRDGGVAIDDDVRLYDAGFLQICNIGNSTSGTQTHDVMVEAIVDFRDPVIDNVDLTYYPVPILHPTIVFNRTTNSTTIPSGVQYTPVTSELSVNTEPGEGVLAIQGAGYGTSTTSLCTCSVGLYRIDYIVCFRGVAGGLLASTNVTDVDSGNYIQEWIQPGGYGPNTSTVSGFYYTRATFDQEPVGLRFQATTYAGGTYDLVFQRYAITRVADGSL